MNDQPSRFKYTRYCAYNNMYAFDCIMTCGVNIYQVRPTRVTINNIKYWDKINRLWYTSQGPLNT